MKKIEKFVLCGCAYTVAVMLAFFTLAAIFSSNAGLNFFNYFICLVIGFALNTTALIFKTSSLKIWWKVLIHYAVLLALFLLFVYISIPAYMEQNGAPFIVIMIYTVLYAIGLAAACGIVKLVRHIDSRLDRSEKSSKKSTKSSSENYTPRYK